MRTRVFIAVVATLTATLMITATAGAIPTGSGYQAIPTGSGYQSVSASEVENYLVRAATAWEAYTTPSGEIADPINPGLDQDNYGSIELADTMLQLSARDHNQALEGTAAAIINRSLQLPETNGPFNLEAVAEFIHDGEAGLFPPGYWPEVANAARAFGAHIVAAAKTGHCLPVPGCYNNWHLVWAVGIMSLLQSGVPLEGAATLEAEALEYMREAAHALSKPSKPTLILGAAELSDPGAEPMAYAAFSAAQLEEIADAAPAHWNQQDQRLRARADAWLLQAMAPDGQLVYAGRSLDQSWAETAGAYVGTREDTLDPARAGEWEEFSSRAFSYLESAYAPTPNNIIPVVPGLPSAPELGIMDPYAGESCYAGMTLWWLMKALDHWPSAQATTSATTQPSSPPTTAPPAGKLPADSSHFVVGDLASSGLVWGRSGPVWWSVQGRRVCGGDPRCEQGLAAVKVWSQGRWRDLLALRPIQRGQTSQWELEFAHGYKVAPEFTSVSTTAHATTLHGIYRNPWGRRRPITWRIQTTATGVVVTMTPTLEAAVIAKIWLAPGAEAVPIAKAVPVTNKHPVVTPKAVFTPEAKTTTASGTATPMLLRWPAGALASVSISEE